MPDRGSVSEHVGSAGVPHSMGGDILFDIRETNAALDHLPDTVWVHLLTPSVQDKIAWIFIIQEPGPDR